MVHSNNDFEDTPACRRKATRFFWVWLTAATAASVTGNVLHAFLNAPNGTRALAAAAAIVPPAVLLGSTHSVLILVRARRVGPAYWCALAMTIGLGSCAFVLSFEALTDLVRTLGTPPGRAWLWPCAIDVSIAQSTIALLSLNTPPSASRRHATDKQPVRTRAQSGVTRSAERDHVANPNTATEKLEPEPSALGRWRPTAQELVGAGVTQKDTEIVAQILAEHAAGTPPTTIGRRLDVHHTTVNRILAGAHELTN